MANFELAIPIIRRSEGGLSKNPNDTASKDPVPDGSGYHTNQGITWTTFKGLAKRLNYVATPALFYQMPANLWNQITKIGYWDPIMGDQIRSQSVATILVDWNFGSGNWSVKNLQSVLNSRFGYKLLVDGTFGPLTLRAVNSVDPKQLTESLQAARIAFIERISKRQPTFRNGWLDDARYTYERAVSYLPAIGGGLLLTLGIFF